MEKIEEGIDSGGSVNGNDEQRRRGQECDQELERAIKRINTMEGKEKESESLEARAPEILPLLR